MFDFRSFVFTMYSGLALGMSNHQFSNPHIYRKSLLNNHNLWRFVINVNWHLLKFVEDDYFNRTSKTYQFIRNIRSIHHSIANKMNKEDNYEEGRDVLWINQLGIKIYLKIIKKYKLLI